MPRPTAQAQSAIDKLLAAGWKRNQFSVRAERRFCGYSDNGKALYEYGDVSIDLRNSSKEEQLEKAQAMADQGLYVGLFQFSDGHYGYPHILAVCWKKPGIYLRKENHKDEYGLFIEEKI